MRRERVVPGKHDMEALMLALKEAVINAKSIPVHMYQGQKKTQHLKDNDETTTVMVQEVHINEITTLCLTTD